MDNYSSLWSVRQPKPYVAWLFMNRYEKAFIFTESKYLYELTYPCTDSFLHIALCWIALVVTYGRFPSHN